MVKGHVDITSQLVNFDPSIVAVQLSTQQCAVQLSAVETRVTICTGKEIDWQRAKHFARVIVFHHGNGQTRIDVIICGQYFDGDLDEAFVETVKKLGVYLLVSFVQIRPL